jgi:hypothetical protein
VTTGRWWCRRPSLRGRCPGTRAACADRRCSLDAIAALHFSRRRALGSA